MKNRFTKYAFLFAAAAVLVWTGCSDLFSPLNPMAEGLIITVSNDAADSRTLFPDMNIVFTKYVLSFSGPEGAEHDNVSLQASKASVIVDDLVLGDWFVTATGYAMINGTEYEVARGSAAVTIVSQKVQPLNISISPLLYGDDGTFTFSVTYPQSKVNSGDVQISPFGGTGGNGKSVDIDADADNTSGSFQLVPGYYLLTIRLYTDYNIIRRAEIVHIYSNLETVADYTFTAGDFTETFILSGTVDVRVNGRVPDSAYIYAYIDAEKYGANYGSDLGYDSVNLSEGNTWSMLLPAFGDDIPLCFDISATIDGANLSKRLDTGTWLVNSQDVSFNLGTIDIKAITLSGTVNVTYGGKPVTELYIGNSWRAITLNEPGANAPWSMLMQSFDQPTDVTFNVIGYQTFTDKFSGYSYQEQVFNVWVDNPVVNAHSNDVSGITINLGNIPSQFAPVNAKPLTANTWIDGNIAVSQAVDWYSLNVTAGNTYYLWWNDTDSGTYLNTLDADVYAWYSDGASMHMYYHDSAWEYPESFTATVNDTIYFRVRNRGGGDYTGTYSIVYSTSDTRPLVGSFSGSVAQRLLWVQANGVSGETYTIDVTADESLAPQELYYGGRQITVVLKGSGTGRTITLGENGTLFRLGGDVTLQLENITLQGRSNNTGPVIYASNRSNLVMNTGTNITGNMNGGGSCGGAVYVYDGATLTMNGGTISGNTAYSGGGVYVDSFGTFAMYGGTVTGNTAYSQGGGVYVASYGTFTKTGGTITGYGSDPNNGNAVINEYGTVQYLRGHAVYASGYSYSDGNYVYVTKYRETTAGTGVDLAFYGNDDPPYWTGIWGDELGANGEVPGANLAAKFAWLQSNAQHDGNYIVEVNANDSMGSQSFNYWDGYNVFYKTVTITLRGDNSARKLSLDTTGSMFTVGTGVTLILEDIILEGRSDNYYSLISVDGTLIMNARSNIINNIATNGDGGGVILGEGGSFTMNGGEISGNTGLRGGGVYVANNADFTMNSGKIYDNTADQFGGGVLVAEGGTFTMNSGEIYGNYTQSNGFGAGVYASGDFTMEGGEIFGNTAQTWGGGVVVSTNRTFKKTQGIIYGYTAGDEKSNKVMDNGTVQNAVGNAILAIDGSGSDIRYRDTTVGETEPLECGYDANGNWYWSNGWDQ